MSRASKEQRQGMIRAYQQGKTMKEAAASYGFQSQKACLNALREAGIKSRRKYLGTEDKQKIIDAYLAGEPSNSIGNRLGHNGRSCRNVLEEAGVMRSLQEAGRFYARHTLDEDFFAVVDSEAKAYWLGFLTADGCVSKNRNQVTVALARKDRGHLLLFLEALGSDVEIYDYEAMTPQGKLKPYSKATISSVKVASDLISLGVVPRKSLIVRPWTGPAHLMQHYWRGVVDGDGSIFENRKHPGAWVVGLVGSLWIVQGFADHVFAVAGNRKRPRRHATSKNVRQVEYGGISTPQQIARHLYEGASVSLERKRIEAGRLMLATRRLRDLSWLTADTLRQLHAEHGSWTAVAVFLKIRPCNLHTIKRRLGIERTRRDWSTLTAEGVKAMYRQHGSWRAVARHLGIAPQHFPKIRRRLGLL